MFLLAYDMNGGSNAVYHRLTLEGREKLTVGGVEDVERFDENCIVMSTCAGTLVVTGEGLHIGKLSLDGGELHIRVGQDRRVWMTGPAETVYEGEVDL